MVQMFTEPLQDLVMVSDGWRLIFTGSKVALQLQRGETMAETPQQRRQLEMLTLAYSIKKLFSPLSACSNLDAGYLQGAAVGFKSTLRQ